MVSKDESTVCSIGGADDGPRPPTSMGKLKNNNQLEMGATKVGGGWGESNGNHTIKTAGNNEC
jgi:hypothetical protein